MLQDLDHIFVGPVVEDVADDVSWFPQGKVCFFKSRKQKASWLERDIFPCTDGLGAPKLNSTC